MKKIFIYAFALLTLSAYSHASITPYTPQGNSTHVKKLDFMRYGDHLFGYLEVFKDAEGINYAKVLFSNGTRTQYQLTAVIVCEVNGQPESSTTFSKKVGWSTGGSVERSQEYRVGCSSSAKLKAYWSKTKLDIISIDDIGKAAETALKVYVSDLTVGELFESDTVGRIFN